MNDSEKFQLWLRNQPGYTTYTQAKTFVQSLIGDSAAEAEVKLAQMQEDDEIKIIQKHSGKGRRIFLKPLDELRIEHIRSVWDGSPRAEQSVDSICNQVHDRTGHDAETVRSYLNELHNQGLAEVKDGERFRWVGQEDE